MRTMLLGLAGAAALTMTAAPATAADSSKGWNGSAAQGDRPDGWRDGGDRGRDRDRRRSRRDVVAWNWPDGDWAYYNNRSFSPDSYNDWWHDRPDRAYPRWMQNNQDCKRLWWSGGGWRC